MPSDSQGIPMGTDHPHRIGNARSHCRSTDTAAPSLGHLHTQVWGHWHTPAPAGHIPFLSFRNCVCCGRCGLQGAVRSALAQGSELCVSSWPLSRLDNFSPSFPLPRPQLSSATILSLQTACPPPSCPPGGPDMGAGPSVSFVAGAGSWDRWSPLPHDPSMKLWPCPPPLEPRFIYSMDLLLRQNLGPVSWTEGPFFNLIRVNVQLRQGHNYPA